MEAFHFSQIPAEQVEGVPGVTVRWLIDHRRGALNYAMRLFELSPGARTPRHCHWYEQEMFVIAGRGQAIGPDGECQPIETGTVLWVKPHEEHQIRNTGRGTLRFICVIPHQRHRTDEPRRP